MILMFVQSNLFTGAGCIAAGHRERLPAVQLDDLGVADFSSCAPGCKSLQHFTQFKNINHLFFTEQPHKKSPAGNGINQFLLLEELQGAVEEGVVHESLNLASHMKLPVLFVCENNLYASHMDIAQRQPNDRTARFADAAGINALVIDGNDITGVADAAGQLIDAARRGEGPGYLEAVTYRWRGHVGPDENIDVGLRRSRSELEAWKERDPVSRLATAMTRRGDITDREIGRLRKSIDSQVDDATRRAREAPYPDDEALLNYVFAGGRR